MVFIMAMEKTWRKSHQGVIQRWCPKRDNLCLPSVILRIQMCLLTGAGQNHLRDWKTVQHFVSNGMEQINKNLKNQIMLLKVLQSMGLAGWDSPPIPDTAGTELWVSAPALDHSGTGAPGAVRDHIQHPMKSRGSASKPGNTFLKAETSFVNT